MDPISPLTCSVFLKMTQTFSTFTAYLDLPRGVEWMIRGPCTPSLRVQTAPFGRCCLESILRGTSKTSRRPESKNPRGVSEPNPAAPFLGLDTLTGDDTVEP